MSEELELKLLNEIANLKDKIAKLENIITKNIDIY